MVEKTRIRKISDREFIESVMESGKPAVVDFWATWCVPCRRLDEILEEMASEYDGRISFFKVDVNESNRTAAQFSIRSIPSLLFVNGGEIVDRASGSISRDAIEEKLRSVLDSA